MTARYRILFSASLFVILALVSVACEADGDDAATDEAATDDAAAEDPVEEEAGDDVADEAGGDDAAGDADADEADAEPADGGELTPVEVLLNWTWYPADHVYFEVGRQQGFFEDHGLDVEIQEGTGSSTTLQMLGTGQADIGYVDAGTMMLGVAEGVPVQSIAVVNQESPMGVMFKAEKGYETIEDLRGASVAITQGDANSAIFPAVLAVNDMEGEVQMVSTGSPAAKEVAMLSDNADAMLGFYTEQGPRVEANEGVEMDAISYAEAGVNTLSMAAFVNTFWLEDNADTAEAFVRALQESIEWTVANPEEAAALFVEEHPDGFTEELALHQIEVSIPLLHTERTEGLSYGVTDEQDWVETQEILAEYLELEPQDDVGVYYTNEFAE